MAEILQFRHPARPNADDVRRLCGSVTDQQIAAILATGARLDEIETAVAWVAGEDDVMGEERRPLAGRAGAVYDILSAEVVEWAEGGPA
ncbi:MAG: hypothetical protein P4M09_06560 [Devosia sp.]|nr:hypothetical protein [Devosia sp.]